MKLNRLAFLLLLLLSACYPPKQPPPPEKGPIAVRINLESEPSTLNPSKARDLASVNIIRILFEGLTHINQADMAELALAKSVAISEDLKTYTFHLRESFWSNHDILTAHDFVYAWKKILSPDFPGDSAYQLYVIRGAKEARAGTLPLKEIGVRALDDFTLEVELENPTPYFLELVSFPAFFPINRKVDKENPDWAQNANSFVSNGPFSLAKWEHQHLLTLERNPLYWEEHKTHLDEIHFAMVTPETELRMFEKGELDWAGSPLSTLPVDALLSLKEGKELQSKPLLGTCFLRCNLNHPLLSSLPMRQALALAINRQDLVTHVLQGGQLPAKSLVPVTLGLQETPYFADGAQEDARVYFTTALSELGKTMKSLPDISLLFPATNRNHLIAQTIQQQWFEAFGIRIRLEPVEKMVYFDRVAKIDYDLAISSWIADFNDPINFLEVFKFRDSGTNNTGWEDPEYISLLNASYKEIDPDLRKQLLAKAEKILMEALPIIPIFQYSMLFLSDQRLKDVVITPMGTIDFRWARMEEETVR
jgi:oligopeptide transport system substrate-binding protein